ncbi:expressed unknown protein [Seminavis robusta]|uniref:PPIase cyclophilin-type domain-containing protein n=1 Tax=Seminavis robusta TaxID=568900 RepID=A0A9N8E1P2_9STRA|nr:expressed unknown protein [Seminavis robusta]|eukprot:Sro562_g167030.1 n/a (446) ;mRNA; f:29584-30921
MDRSSSLHHHHHHHHHHRLGSSNGSSGSLKQAKTVLPLHKYNRQPSEGSQRSNSNSPPSYRNMTHRFNSIGGRHNNSEDNVTLPTWSANPQSPVDDTSPGGSARNSPTSHLPLLHNSYLHPHQYHEWRRRCCSWTTLFYSILLGVTIAIALQSRGSLTESMGHLSQLIHNGHILQGKLDDAEKGIKLLQREVSAYDVMRQHQNQNNSPQNSNNNKAAAIAPALAQPHNQALEEMQQLDARLRDSQTKAETLKRTVQALSKREALQKYGNHVHRVEIELAFPDPHPHYHLHSEKEGPTTFIIELAPIELMPHSVHFFLEMVHAGLLDGCSFILNALHVLKAAPLPYDGSSAANKARAFTRMGLESVAFKEYAPSYPHEQYTVGFAADGSPSFYINTEDNSEIHLGDPCFGKIVEGFDTVKRLEASPTRNGIWFEQRIGIQRATVLM